jgi:hypothetical protein
MVLHEKDADATERLYDRRHDSSILHPLKFLREAPVGSLTHLNALGGTARSTGTLPKPAKGRIEGRRGAAAGPRGRHAGKKPWPAQSSVMGVPLFHQLRRTSMAFRALIQGVMQPVDLVQMVITCSSRKSDGSRPVHWDLGSQSPEEENPDEIEDGGASRTVTLYRASMEAGDTQKIYDGESTYYLAAWGLGKWNVKMQLRARKTGSGTGLVKLDEVGVSADFYYGSQPWPRSRNVTMTEVFQRF